MGTRRQNERKFANWTELPNGGRRYWRDVPGQTAGTARYIKVVDSNETTLSLRQEIYDDNGKLVEIHDKYPVDTGHRMV